QIADRGDRGQRLTQRGALRERAGWIPGPTGQPLLEQFHLGGKIVVPALVVRQAGGRVTGLPRADLPLAGLGPYPDRAVGVDPPPLAAGHDRILTAVAP